jgi:transcriptional regulator with XRE-family HTH domain
MNSKAVKKFAENMKKIREAKGITQGDIFRATKIERAYVSNLESGKQNPTLETIEKIAKTLGVGIDELLK